MNIKKVTKRKYNPDCDFICVRDFLVKTYALWGKSINWTVERWNYARYFGVPMIGINGKAPPTVDDSQKAIRFWEDHIRIWENSEREVIAVTAFEYPWLGDLFFLRHPDYNFVLDEMFSDAVKYLFHPTSQKIHTHILDQDHILQEIAERHGFSKMNEWMEDISEFIPKEPISSRPLPPGFVIQSMAEEGDLDRRRKAFGRGFNHQDPNEWPSLFSYQELQRAPDYRKELDLYVRAPDGEYASFCIGWLDAANKIGNLEPVGTVPEHRRKGLASAVVMEGIRRLASMGAKKVLVGSGQDFYTAIGFKKTLTSYTWVKKVRDNEGQIIQ